MAMILRRRKNRGPLQRLARLYLVTRAPRLFLAARLVRLVRRARSLPRGVWIGVPVALAGAGVAVRKMRSSGGDGDGGSDAAASYAPPSPPASTLKAVGENPGSGGSGPLDVDAPNESAPGHHPEDAGKHAAGGGA